MSLITIDVSHTDGSLNMRNISSKSIFSCFYWTYLNWRIINGWIFENTQWSCLTKIYWSSFQINQWYNVWKWYWQLWDLSDDIDIDSSCCCCCHWQDLSLQINSCNILNLGQNDMKGSNTISYSTALQIQYRKVLGI